MPTSEKPAINGSSRRHANAHLRCLLILVISAAVVDASAPSSTAFGLFSAIGDAVGGVLHGVGSVLGAGVGGFVGAATAPTINQAEAAGHRLIDDANKSFAVRIDQVDQVLDRNIGKLDASLEKRIAQVDKSLQARITQVDIAMRDRINQLDGVLASSIADVDDVLQKRIDQVDELAGKRIGNLDVVATKASYTLEDSMTRLIGIACLMIFCAAAVWRAYVEFSRVKAGAPGLSFLAELQHRFRGSWRPLSIQLAGAAVALVGLYALFAYLPGGPRHRLDNLATLHVASLNRSLAVLDIRQAKFHAAQLEVLDSTSSRFRGLALKVDLIDQVLSRPTSLQSQSGVSQASFLVDEIERYLGEGKDPDVETIKGIILWRMGPTKVYESVAAQLCATALSSPSGKDFPLRPLALEYLDNYLSKPIATEVQATLKSNNVSQTFKSTLDVALKVADSRKQPSPFEYVYGYNRLVRNLHKETVPVYLQMLDSEVELTMAPDPATRTAAQDKRKTFAKILNERWKKFTLDLQENGLLRSTSAPLAAMLLNDAIQARAILYAADNVKLNPEQVAVRVTDQPDDLRKQIGAELCRLVIDRTFASSMLSHQTHDVVDFEESERFQQYEGHLVEFESKYMQFKKLAATNAAAPDILKTAYACCDHAAALNLYDYSQESARPLSEMVFDTVKQKVTQQVVNQLEATSEIATVHTSLTNAMQSRSRDYL